MPEIWRKTDVILGLKTFWIKLRGLNPDDGGSRFFRNAGILLPDYTATDLRMQYSSCFNFVKYQRRSGYENRPNLGYKAV